MIVDASSSLEKKSFTPQQRKVLFLSSLGGVLEFYDFIIYIFLAPYIEKIFFTSDSQFVATLKTLVIFSIGYLFRPIGGILFSHFGDRYGRKVVFLLTVILMAVPSLLIGCLPTPAQIGIMSPILLLLMRLLQGLALGGEIPAAITFVSEHVDDNRHGIALAILFFGINSGLLLGSFIASITTSYFTADEMISYAWRIPFILGGLFGILSIYLRRYLHETQAFITLKTNHVERIPLLTLMRFSTKEVILGTMLVATGAVTVFFYLYWPQYLSQYMQYDFSTLMRINTISTLVLNFSIIVGGLCVDRYGAKNIYFILTASLILTSFPLFYAFSFQSLFFVTLVYFIFSIMFGFIPSAYSTLLARSFPTETRYSGIALCYNLSYAFFGGLSPIICTLAIHYFNSLLAPAGYIAGIACVSWLGCYFSGKRQPQQCFTENQKESIFE